MFKLLIALYMVRLSLSLNIVVGKDDCIGSCVNYHKAGSDAFDAIQDAFNKVRNAGGGRVTINEGLYILSKNIEMYSNTELIGAGMDKTILKLQDFAASYIIGTSKRSGFLRSVYKVEKKCENLYVAHLTLDGNKEKQNTDYNSVYGRYGYFTEACTNVYLDSVRVENFQGYGFDPHGWKSAPNGPIYGNNLTIVNCVANDNDWDGFTLDQTNGMYLKNNTAIKNGRHGFNVVTGTFNGYITDAYSYYNGYYFYQGTSGCGFTIQNNQQYGTHNVVVVNSIFADDKKGGVCTNDVYNITINNVHITTQRQCLRFENSRDFVVTNNVCNHTQIFNERNVTNIFKSNNTVGIVNISINTTIPNDTTVPSDTDDDNVSVCSSNVQNKRVCCASSCGTCGGTRCGSRPGGSINCCQTQILASGRYCDDFDAPCIL
jgi:hypothetical protein